MVGTQQDQLKLLEEGEIISSNLTLWGSNYTFLVQVRDEAGRECYAVYKPRDGEAPLWDFPTATLYKRECAAYLLSQLLGWSFIPPTVIREGPYGIGSLQLFVDHDPRSNYFTVRGTHEEQLKAFACFDLVANNTDRKASHCILGEDDKVWGIDHGLTFHEDLKVRTVIWDFSGQAIPPEFLAGLAALEKELGTPKQTLKELLSLLEPEEVIALAERVRWILAERIYPGVYRRRS